MRCPRCAPAETATGPYRDASEAARQRPRLLAAAHEGGVELDACVSCGGIWLDHGELQRIETVMRDRRERADADRTGALLSRAYARGRSLGPGGTDERPPLACPRCAGEMFEREWSIGTIVFADVCVECRGVWLDPGELDALEELFAAR